jgi:hypothetical protein
MTVVAVKSVGFKAAVNAKRKTRLNPGTYRGEPLRPSSPSRETIRSSGLFRSIDLRRDRASVMRARRLRPGRAD